jgi:hypothetical protein
VHLDKESDFALIKSDVLMSGFYVYFEVMEEEEEGGHMDSNLHKKQNAY